MKAPIYFEEEMRWNEIFSKSSNYVKLEAPTKANASVWANKINCDMSPENLCCDGEASATQIRSQARKFRAAMKYLEQLVGETLRDF